jgi:hypothetical protein
MIDPDSWHALATSEMLRWFFLGVALGFAKMLFRVRRGE